MKSKIGVNLYSVRESAQTLPDLASTLEKIAGIGYQGVQISGIGEFDPEDVLHLAEETGLEIAATHTPWVRFLTEIEAVIDTHHLWRCKHAAIGSLPVEYYILEGLSKFKEEVLPVASTLAAEGMDFSYHNHNQEFAKYDGKTWLERLLTSVSAEYLKAELDTYWVQAGGGDPAWWITFCAGREPLLHVKDMVTTPDRKQRFAEIGQGNLNWPSIIKAAAAGGVEWYLVEQDQHYAQEPFESLAVSYRALRNMGLG